MAYINTTFLGKEYSIPRDILTYIDLLDFTESVKKQLVNAFVRKLNAEIQKGNTACLDDKDLSAEIERQVGYFIAKLCDNGIFNRTISDYLRNNKGYQLYSDVNKAALEKMKSLLIREMDSWQAGFEDAMQKKESSVTGMGFSIWSSSFINHAIYAAMEASTVDKQEKAAAVQYQKDMNDLRARLDSQYGKEKSAYVHNTYIPHMEAALTVFAYELLDKYVADLIANGKFDSKTLDYVDIGRSNDLLKNLTLSNNKKAILENAFAACPYNIAVYEQATKYELLDYDSFQTAKLFNQHMPILWLLKKSLGEVEYPEKFKLNYGAAKKLAEFTQCDVISILQAKTTTYVDLVIKAYGNAAGILGNRSQAARIMSELSETAILSGNAASKGKASAYINGIVSQSVWSELTEKCGFTDLLDKIKAQVPGTESATTKRDVDVLLEDKLYPMLEEARKIRENEIRQKRADEAKRKEEEAENAKRTVARNKMAKRIALIAAVLIIAIIIASTVINNISNAKAYQEMSGTYLVHSVVYKDGDPYYDYNWWLDIAKDGSFEMASYSYVYEGTQVEQILGVIKTKASISEIDDFTLDATAYDNVNYCYEIKFDDGDTGFIVGWTNEDIRQVEIFCGNSRYAFSETSPNHTFTTWSRELTSIVELYDLQGNKSNKISDWSSFDVVLLWGRVPSSWQVSFNSEEEEGFPTEGTAKNIVNGNVIEELHVSYMGKYENFLGFFANHKYADLFDEIKIDSKSKSYAMIDVDENRNVIVDWYLLRGGRMYHITYSVPMEKYDEGKMMEILYEILY